MSDDISLLINYNINNNDYYLLTRKERCIWCLKRFGTHFVNQFKPRQIFSGILLHPYLLFSMIVAFIAGIFLIKNGLPWATNKYIFSAWTAVTIGHLIQVWAGLFLPNEPRLKRILKVPFHLLVGTCSFLYWLKMGDWMHYGFHHFLYASIMLYYTFERLGKSVAVVIGIPLAISDIVGYGEFPIFHKPYDSNGLDDVLKDSPWVFLIPTGILFLCELLIEGPLVETIKDWKNIRIEPEDMDLSL